MNRRTLLQSVSVAAFLPSSLSAGAHEAGQDKEPGAETVYELRLYHAAPGKLEQLLARFRDHTVAIFARHGMKSVAYWVPVDEPQKSYMLIYILRHPSRAEAEANWKSFQDDAEWKSVKAKSEENGTLVEKVDSTFMSLTDFSPRVR
jgi:NIPSNAP